MGKTINYLLVFILLTSIVYAANANYEYLYNPYTAKRDRTLKLNQSGYNTTYTNGTFDNLLVKNPPVRCPTGTYMVYSNMTTAICVSAMRITGENVTGFYNYSDNMAINDTLYVYDGRVGIGTSSPAVKLEISESQTSGAIPVFRVQNTHTGNTLNTFELLTPNMPDGGYMYMAMGKEASNNNRAGIKYLHVSDGSTSNRIDFGVYGNDELFSVLASGNIGIGTTSPSYLLQVANTSNAVNLSGIFYVDGDTGNVGIGTASPGGMLDIIGSDFPVFQVTRQRPTSTDSISSTFRLITETAGNMVDGFGGGIIFSFADDTQSATNAARIVGIRDGGDALGALRFDTGGLIEAMRITSTGNVGIGTTSPTANLHIDETITDVTTANTLSKINLTLNTTANIGASQTALDVNFNVITARDIHKPLKGINIDMNTENTDPASHIEAAYGIYIDVVSDASSDNNAYGLFVKNVSGGTGNLYGIYSNASENKIENKLIVGNLETSEDIQLARSTVQNTTGKKIVWGRTEGPFIASYKTGTDSDSQAIVIYDHESASGGNAALFNTIFRDGNVGIGITSPNYKLDVMGDVNASNYYINGSSIFEILDNNTILRTNNMSDIRETAWDFANNDTFVLDNDTIIRSNFNGTLGAYYLYPNGTNPISLNHLVNKEFVELAVSGLTLDYFFTNVTSDIAGYYVLNNTERSAPQSIVESVSLSSGNNQSVFNFSTTAGLPFIFLSEGIYDAHIHLDKTGGAAQIIHPRWELHKRNSSGDFLITISETSNVEITGTNQIFNLHAVFNDDVPIVSTDRLVIKLFVDITGGGSSTVRLYMEGTTDSHFTFRTPSSVLQEIFIRRDGTNGLTGNWNVGGFDITAQSFIGSGSSLTGVQKIGDVWTKTNESNYLRDNSYLTNINSTIIAELMQNDTINRSITCAGLTGSEELCDGDDAVGTGANNCSVDASCSTIVYSSNGTVFVPSYETDPIASTYVINRTLDEIGDESNSSLLNHISNNNDTVTSSLDLKNESLYDLSQFNDDLTHTVDTDTRAKTDNDILYNDSDTHYFNKTSFGEGFNQTFTGDENITIAKSGNDFTFHFVTSILLTYFKTIFERTSTAWNLANNDTSATLTQLSSNITRGDLITPANITWAGEYGNITDNNQIDNSAGYLTSETDPTAIKNGTYANLINLSVTEYISSGKNATFNGLHIDKKNSTHWKFWG